MIVQTIALLTEFVELFEELGLLRFRFGFSSKPTELTLSSNFYAVWVLALCFSVKPQVGCSLIISVRYLFNIDVIFGYAEDVTSTIDDNHFADFVEMDPRSGPTRVRVFLFSFDETYAVRSGFVC